MSNIFEEILRRGEQGGVLTTQEFLQGVAEPTRPQLVKKKNPLTGVLEKSFTKGQDDQPLVLLPEERAMRSEKEFGGTIAQQLGQQKVAEKPVVEKLTKELTDKNPPVDLKKGLNKDAAISAGLTQAAGLAGGSDSIAGGALGGAGTGFAIGGPVGAGIGAVAGGIAGGLGAKAKQKQRKANAEAQAQQNIANIALDTGRNRNVALRNIMEAFQSAFTRR